MATKVTDIESKKTTKRTTKKEMGNKSTGKKKHICSDKKEECKVK